jgi:hypothetical protein
VVKRQQVRKVTLTAYTCQKIVHTHPQSEGFTARDPKCSYMGSKLTRGLKREGCLSLRKKAKRGRGCGKND